MTNTEMLELIAWQANEIKNLKTRCDDQLRVSMQLQAMGDVELHKTKQSLKMVERGLEEQTAKYAKLEIQYNRLVNQVNKSCNA